MHGAPAPKKSINMNEIEFKLKYPITFAGAGGIQTETDVVILKRPTGKISHLCSEVECLINTALISMSDKISPELIAEAKESEAKKNEAVDDSESEKDGKGILAMMLSSGADMNKITLMSRSIFMVSAFMGGEKPFTSPRLDDLDHKDFMAMTGVYIENFIMI